MNPDEVRAPGLSSGALGSVVWICLPEKLSLKDTGQGAQNARPSRRAAVAMEMRRGLPSTLDRLALLPTQLGKPPSSQMVNDLLGAEAGRVIRWLCRDYGGGVDMGAAGPRRAASHAPLGGETRPFSLGQQHSG
ncbi:hypothetical protein AAFF_G00104860 [Aldrovandia affinis]|uniref:Uncharacterized protein n=1 Tax=Aldrovandia affinis TaxID=143900 RepID=A0AAD7WYI9_9TELE|nr:hypothetical protein AAFF_G00104860 [Aldrovandia affinis]